MPVTYDIDQSRRLVTFSYVGDTSFDEFRRAASMAFGDRAYSKGYSFLADRSKVEAPSAEYIRKVSEFLHVNAGQIEGARWATVVASLAGYGMGRMAQALNEDLPVEIGVFTDVDAALGWLSREEH